MKRGASAASSLGLLLLAGCEPAEACDEDARAQVLEARVLLELGAGQDAVRVEAELADDPVERDRGWRYRRCDREGLWLVPDAAPEPLPVWGCGLSAPIDVYFVADGEVVAVESGLSPCGGETDCGSCARVGEGIEVDGVLEVPEGAFAVRAGDPVAILEP